MHDPLCVVNLSKRYNSAVQALRDVSFSVKSGEVFGLLGPNGAGKTSLISIIVTLEKATSGEVRLFGESVNSHSRRAKSLVGWVPQEVINHGYFSVLEILRFHAGFYGVRDAEDRIQQLLRDLDLMEHREKKVRQLSGGMKRRLMIAKALVHDPKLLLLDEPTAGVDVELRFKLWSYISELKRRGLSILLTTHYLEEAERLCDRVAIINHGQLRAVGNTHDLIRSWTRKYVTLKLNKPYSNLQHPGLVRGQEKEWVFTMEMDKPLGLLLSELKIPSDDIMDVHVTEGSLEDVFVHFTKAEVQ